MSGSPGYAKSQTQRLNRCIFFFRELTWNHYHYVRSRDIFPEFFVGVLCCLLAKQSFHLVAAFFPSAAE